MESSRYVDATTTNTRAVAASNDSSPDLATSTISHLAADPAHWPAPPPLSETCRETSAASYSLSPPSSNHSNTTVTGQDDHLISKQRKQLFGDCALIEIIHLHDCLRGALKALEQDVVKLTEVLVSSHERQLQQQDPNKVFALATLERAAVDNNAGSVTDAIDMNKDTRVAVGSDSSRGSISIEVADLERRVTSRFKVIWSVFKSHSSAEDEFIWPALRHKTHGVIRGSPRYTAGQAPTLPETSQVRATTDIEIIPSAVWQPIAIDAQACASGSSSIPDNGSSTVTRSRHDDMETIPEEEYEEDHADEERMFSEMDRLLTQLREFLLKQRQARQSAETSDTHHHDDDVSLSLKSMALGIHEQTQRLSEHLLAHLVKEERHCLPLVVKHLSKSEIHELVGNIMGKRSADTIAQIMTMAVQNLDDQDREEMVRYMKQSMAGTFFDRWLLMSGWMSSTNSGKNDNNDQSKNTSSLDSTAGIKVEPSPVSDIISAQQDDKKREATHEETVEQRGSIKGDNRPMATKRPRGEGRHWVNSSEAALFQTLAAAAPGVAHAGITSQAELEKLIRAIASNHSLTPQQKNTTIQGLRDSVWKSNLRYKEMHEAEQTPVIVNAVPVGPVFGGSCASLPIASPPSDTSVKLGGSRARRGTPPSVYYKRTKEGKIEMVWSSEAQSSTFSPTDTLVPLFSASELAPTYHDGAAGTVLGCPHYARACKLRHPSSGRLYTCRLCCEQQRGSLRPSDGVNVVTRDQQHDEQALDRYAVTEVMCMKCNALQPAEDRCMNPDCESFGKPFARYFCRICHLYDDGTRPIFHCPYCNTCRLGLGLGIDFRHCMRCNACVSLSDDDHHCIPQSLQGTCPICHETLFESTEPLKGLKCGHVMHLACFSAYRRGTYVCPICMRSMEDMKDYFALIDTAVRMQPMPAGYLSTLSNIYCQDCCSTGRVQYHFVGLKCQTCNSYNTRELGRVHNSP